MAIGRKLAPAAACTGGVSGVGVGSLECELPDAANLMEGDSMTPLVVGARGGLEGVDGIGVVGWIN